MAKNHREEKNINEPGGDIERPYYDSKGEKAEKEKLPVEYLGYLEKRKEHRFGAIFLWIVLGILILGVGPGTKGMDYCPRDGEVRRHITFMWGKYDYADLPKPTPFTEWYESLRPEPHEMKFLPYGKVFPALFGYIAFPIFVQDLGWKMPDNLVDRMKELQPKFRPNAVLNIPRVLQSVNDAREWNAIILPLTLGTADEAYRWWSNHEDELMGWAFLRDGSPLPLDYINEAGAYIKEKETPENPDLPLFTELTI
jgi:hypothetical protein